MNVFPTFLHKTLAQQKGFTVAQAMAVLKPIDKFNFAAWDGLGTGNKAEQSAAEILRGELEGGPPEADEGAGIEM